MNKSLLIILCLIFKSFTVSSQEIQVEFEDENEIKKVIDVVSKRAFKDSKIQLLDIDEVVSEVENENVKNINKIKNSVENDSIIKSVQSNKEKLNSNVFEDPFKETGQHPGHNFPDEEAVKQSGLSSNEIFPTKNLSSITSEGLLPELLTAPSLKELPPIRGSKIKTKYLNLIDSIRAINLSDGKMKLSEKVEGKSKEVIIKEKQSIRDKTYFEGVVGVLGDNFKMMNISPALGYQLMKKYSMGLGPEIKINHGKNNPLSMIGMRSFAKYEIIKKKIYFQLEDVSTPFKNSKDLEEMNSSRKKMNHSLSLGGGYLLHLNKSSSLNFSFMYMVNKNNLSIFDVSPLSFRLGVSSFGGSRNNKL